MFTTGIGALIFGIVGIIGFGWLLTVQRRLRAWTTALVFPIIIFGIAAGAVLSGRNFMAEAADVFAATTGSPTVIWFFRLTTIGILGICLARLLSASPSLEHRGRAGRALFFAFLFYYVTNLVLNNILGTDPVFHDRFLPAVIMFTAMYFSRGQDRMSAINAAKWGLFLFIILGSLAL